MPLYDFRTPRLFVEPDLTEGAMVPLAAPQGHYLQHVLRLTPGAGVLAFNGRDGEWQARLAEGGKRLARLEIGVQARPQPTAGTLHLLFAPLKHARLDYMVQKAVEMGVAALVPVLTQHTQVSRVNTARMRANAIEAAEQCGILSLAAIAEPMPLEPALAARLAQRALVFCDEDAPVCDPVAALSALAGVEGIDVLIGPEGGFSEQERAMLTRQERVVPLSLGPRILRADTAAVAALAIVQAAAGDWR